MGSSCQAAWNPLESIQITTSHFSNKEKEPEQKKKQNFAALQVAQTTVFTPSFCSLQ